MTVVEVAARHAANSVAGLIGAERFEDPENARTILLMAGGLVLLAVLVSAGTVWWWRSTKVEHPALGPLEVMGSRSWWKGDYTARRRRLDAVRPAGELAEGGGSAAEAVDLDAIRRGAPPHFDDLADGPPVVPVEALAGATVADLDALLAAAGAAIASAHSADTRDADSHDADALPADALPADEPSIVEPSVVELSVVELSVVEPDVETDVEPVAEPDDPTIAVEGARAPIDPLLRVPRND